MAAKCSVQNMENDSTQRSIMRKLTYGFRRYGYNGSSMLHSSQSNPIIKMPSDDYKCVKETLWTDTRQTKIFYYQKCHIEQPMHPHIDILG